MASEAFSSPRAPTPSPRKKITGGVRGNGGVAITRWWHSFWDCGCWSAAGFPWSQNAAYKHSVSGARQNSFILATPK
ncbi:hypothetical protein EYF80_056637 [Liparis tanakae]|uniref:Uncharacterized protein n=1 Tax=Liparis tanakae TaxID=230148 RepID=A0A4Z2EWM0_9TELE|nr:hypothetical protein EYF80_056637 [Liparis tanakae]